MMLASITYGFIVIFYVIVLLIIAVLLRALKVNDDTWRQRKKLLNGLHDLSDSNNWAVKLLTFESVSHNKHLLINLRGGDWRKLYRSAFTDEELK